MTQGNLRHDRQQRQYPGQPCRLGNLIAQLEAVEAIPADDSTDDDIDLEGEIMRALMAMPDLAALPWKLDYALAADSGDYSLS